jgi:magnesium chelatase family protein
MNPCPCGEGSVPGACRCTEAGRARYAGRVSGPLLDRFDLRVVLERPDVVQLLPSGTANVPELPESSMAVAARVSDCRTGAIERGVRCNAELPAPRLDEVASLAPAARTLLEARLRDGRLSARGLHRVRRVARTLADLAGRPGRLEEEDVCAALLLRTDPFATGPLTP